MGRERPLGRVKHGAPPIRPLWAEPGGQKGGSLPSQHSLLVRPNGSVQETVTHSGEKRCAAGMVEHGRALSWNTGGGVRVPRENAAWNGPKRLLEAGCNDDRSKG